MEEIWETKTCNVCNEEKMLEEFYFRKDIGKYRNECKECHLKKGKENRKNNINKYKAAARKYRELHHEEILSKKREYREKNRKELRQKAKKYYKDNIDEIKEKRKLNRKKTNETTRIYVENRKKNDKIYAFKCRIRPCIIKSFQRKKYIKRMHLEEIVGKSIDELINYLLQTYKDNYGYEWDGIEKVHIDHKKPLKLAQTEEDVIKLCHYTNLQLLKAEHNLEKGAKLDWSVEI